MSTNHPFSAGFLRRDRCALCGRGRDVHSLTTEADDPRLGHGIDETGGIDQHGAYLVLSDEERAKGFVRPVRRSYIHLVCGGLTTMSQDLAETYARQPDFYGATYCVGCRGHFAVGPEGEFVWDGSDDKVGT